MNKQMLKRIWCAVIGLVTTVSLTPFAETNFFRPFDYALRMPLSKCKHRKRPWHLGVSQLEYGSRKTGRTVDEKRRNILQLRDCTQSALNMLLDQTPCVKQRVGDIGVDLINNLEDVNTQGRLCFTGDFREFDVTFFGGYTFGVSCIPGSLKLDIYLPVVCKEVHNIKICDLTEDDPVFTSGKLIKREITNDLVNNVKKWGCLDLCKWDKCGLGDLVIMLEWFKRYEQTKDYLKAVTIFAKLGVLCPTSDEKDEDKAFSIPLGYDGSWGLPCGVSMDMDFIYSIKAGIDVDFLVLFDKTRVRRMKTDRTQTEFLLLNKGQATKEYGLTWQFHLYAQWYHFFRGLSAKIAYQYVKHDNDRLCPRCNDFSFPIVNADNRLEEWSVHNLIFMVNYDCFKDMRNSSFIPQFSFFYKLPVSGKNIIDTHTVGGQVTVKF